MQPARRHTHRGRAALGLGRSRGVAALVLGLGRSRGVAALVLGLGRSRGGAALALGRGRGVAALARVAALAALAALAACSSGDARAAAGDPAACRIATVAGVAVTDADAAELAGALSPAPGRDEARRLAVDAALAHWLVRGHVAPASASRRLASYRELLARLAVRQPDTGAHARAAVAYLARAAEQAGLTPGPCLAPAALPPGLALPPVTDAALAALRVPPRTLERRLAERARGRPLLRGTAWRVWPSLERIELGPVLDDELEPGLGRALAAAAPGAWTPPVETRTGLYIAQRAPAP